MLKDPQTYAIIGAAMNVHQELGHGFLEGVYQEALAIELSAQKIPFMREVDLPVHYRTHPLSVHYRADFICYDSIIIELKALQKLSNNETAQVINYLKATRLDRSLLINFGAPTLEYKRIVHSKNDPHVNRISRPH